MTYKKCVDDTIFALITPLTRILLRTVCTNRSSLNAAVGCERLCQLENEYLIMEIG